MKTSSHCPTLRTLLTKPNKQEPASVGAQQVAVSYPGTMVPISNAGDHTASIPTFLLSDMSTVDNQAIQDLQNISNNPFTSCSFSQAGSQVVMATDMNVGIQDIWSQDNCNQQQSSFVGLLQTDNISSQQPFNFTQNPNETGSMLQFIANSAAGNQSAANVADTTGNQQPYGFTQNQNEVGAMLQHTANVATGNQPIVTMADTTGRQQAGFYDNTGLSQTGGENIDPSLTVLPKNIDEEYIVNFVIHCIFPKMAQDQKEKLLATLQEPTSPQPEKLVHEGEPTPEDMVTSSSSGPLPFK